MEAGCERSIYGTEFEVRLRNQLTQKAIAKECAEWIKNKVKFLSNTTDASMQKYYVVDESVYMPIEGFTTVDLEEMSGGINIMDLGLNEFRMDLLAYRQLHPEIDHVPFGIHAVVEGEKPGRGEQEFNSINPS